MRAGSAGSRNPLRGIFGVVYAGGGSRRGSTLSALLRRLGEERLAAPGRSLSPESLIADMWPGEKIIPKAARNRLHIAVRTLRTMGLGTVLRSNTEGYHFDPTAPFQFVGEAPSIPPRGAADQRRNGT